MRSTILAVLALLLAGPAAGAAPGPVGELRVAIQRPAGDVLLPELKSSLEVEGGASIFGGVKYLDLFLVLDTSKSLEDTDPRDYRRAGAIGLVKALPRRSDIQIGVVDFDRNADLLMPLTPDRAAVIRVLNGLDRHGSTDLAEGIHAALEGFADGAREGSSRVLLLFTDGKSNGRKARAAMAEARRRGVAIHTLLLGSDRKGTEILRDVAQGTGGSFLRVTDPSRLPEAFLNLRTTGVDRVELSANGSPPVRARLRGGTFIGRVPLRAGQNRIVATATSTDGRTARDEVTVVVASELRVEIDTPDDGALYTERPEEATVEGTATMFAGLAPELLASQPDHGIDRVVLRVDQSPPFATVFEGGRFKGRVLLHEGENRILATATSRDGRVADASVTVTVRAPGCGELEVKAFRGGRPALSVSDRAVEIVVDASGSMWGQIGGRSKMEIARDILTDALDWLPDDLGVALRAYGHQQPKERRDCRDTQLLVPFASGNRGQIRSAISSFKPRGQTPLGYSLEQVAADFRDVPGERAVVLVTDGIESCGGDPVSAARNLRQRLGVPVHVIGFGIGARDDQDQASLRAIAEASGGRFLTASSAQELRDALSVTVGTAWRVHRDGVQVAQGTLGADEVLLLPAGRYSLQLESQPPLELPLEIAAEESLGVRLERRASRVASSEQRRPTAYTSCSGPLHTAVRKRRASERPEPPAAPFRGL